MNEQPSVTRLLTETLKAQEEARLAGLHAGELTARATNLELQLRVAMVTQGVKKLVSDEHQLDVTVVTRRDVRIDSMDEFAAALIEAGMNVPMSEPRPDTAACKKVAKSFPDMPGVEPIETIYLKWTGHTS